MLTKNCIRVVSGGAGKITGLLARVFLFIFLLHETFKNPTKAAIIKKENESLVISVSLILIERAIINRPFKYN
jgi:hypothetical protein